MRQAGLSTPPPIQPTYSDAEKVEFLRRLAVVGNVSLVALELGFNRVTCDVLAHKAGIFTAEYEDAKRQKFLRLRREGVSHRIAAVRLRIAARQTLYWGKDIRKFSTGRLYPDGRVVLYRLAEVLANVKNPRTARSAREATCHIPLTASR